ncbi:DnaB-like helicase C-terminal domain-containing protein [Butyrivibrio sp. NC2007]|uniref:DnaB-like helicase C-terminal domain-containing protein n=1 Tax=Butyrivibrio sp. NC2007 TaxID=1280683 RepID=UPI0003B3F841|nr:DnaB-like helicase C-terminal domain-containing protein [Butyrivibrio sp. NC2007]
MPDTTNVNDYSTQIKSFVDNLEPVISKKNPFIDSRFEKSVRISTGWLSMDIALNGGFSNELYILGAETSTGKSALLMNMAQNIAQQDINVLYFSLEMSADEYIARAISSFSFLASIDDSNKRKITPGDVLYWTYDHKEKTFTKLSYETYDEYVDKYFATYGNHLYIVESNISGFSAKDIANICALFKKSHPNEKLVVFIDYLQILKADADDRTQADRKTKMDVSVTVLKTLASQIGMPVITVSSISRSNYNGTISTSSFKESGDTEYTAGVLIGWNWHGVTDTCDKAEIAIEKEACNQRGYRKMVFDVLKYRNSQRDHGVKLIYFPAYSYFFDEYDWHPDFDTSNPFESWDAPSGSTSSPPNNDSPKKPEYSQTKLSF